MVETISGKFLPCLPLTATRKIMLINLSSLYIFHLVGGGVVTNWLILSDQ